MKLNCECGNETDFLEETTVSFSVDGRGNREEKMFEETEYQCREYGEPVEIVE